MNIVHVSPKYFPSVGGVEYTVQKMVEGLLQRGHNVSVICGNPSIKNVETTEINGVKVINIPTYAPKNNFHYPKNKKAIRKFLENDIDIVHTHSAHAMIGEFPLTLKKSTNPKWKLVYSMHFSTPGYSFFRKFLWKILWQNRIKSSLQYVDAIHSTSSVESRAILNHFANAKSKLTTIPLGITDDVFQYRWNGENSDYILYCGRLEKYKQLDLAIKSIEIVRQKGYDIKFYIVGTGARSNYLRKIAKENDHIICYNPLSREKYLTFLANARAVINLSDAENFNLFLAEACVMGVPIIATPDSLAFCPDFATVSSRDATHVSSIIINSLMDPQSSIISKSCMPQSWDEIVDQLETFYVNLVGGC